MSETHAVIRSARTCSPANGTTAVGRPHTCALIDSLPEHDSMRVHRAHALTEPLVWLRLRRTQKLSYVIATGRPAK
jgi:hypothetical protein